MTIGILGLSLLLGIILWDLWAEMAGSPERPTDCADEDVPIFETEDVPAKKGLVWSVDKDGRLKARKK
jgi:hypothetical protein